MMAVEAADRRQPVNRPVGAPPALVNLFWQCCDLFQTGAVNEDGGICFGRM